MLDRAHADRTNLGQQWLRPRKGRGTIACPEKAELAQVVHGANGHGKTCTAKATLPEPQFAAADNRSGAAGRLARHSGWNGGTALKPPKQPRLAGEASPSAASSIGGASERTGRLNTSHLPPLQLRDPLQQAARQRRPVWGRSRRSTQKPGVTAGTAAARAADGRRDKPRATEGETPSGQGKGGSDCDPGPIREAC